MAAIWFTRPSAQAISNLVEVGQGAPRTVELSAPEQQRLAAFIGHVGCPFAENTVKQRRAWAEAHPQVAVFVVSHGDESSTNQWRLALGGLGRIGLVIDTQRQIYGQWGVGFSHFLILEQS